MNASNRQIGCTLIRAALSVRHYLIFSNTLLYDAQKHLNADKLIPPGQSLQSPTMIQRKLGTKSVHIDLSVPSTKLVNKLPLANSDFYAQV